MEEFQRQKYSFSIKRTLSLVDSNVIKVRGEEIKSLNSDLMKYNVLIKDLINIDISTDIKNDLLNIAIYIVENIDLYREITTSKKINIEKLHQRTKRAKKYIEKYADFIITYMIIFGDKKYKHIKDYMHVSKVDGNEKVKDVNNKKLQGIVLLKGGKKAIILTQLGEFKKVLLKGSYVRGEEVTAKEEKFEKRARLFIIGVGVLVIGLISLFLHIDNISTTTIVITTTSPIKLEVNRFNRVISISSETEKGNYLIDDTKVDDDNIDSALYKIVKYANENEMVPGSGIALTVAGKKINYDDIKKTEKYVYENYIRTKINNIGEEYTIN